MTGKKARGEYNIIVVNEMNHYYFVNYSNINIITVVYLLLCYFHREFKSVCKYRIPVDVFWGGAVEG